MTGGVWTICNIVGRGKLPYCHSVHQIVDYPVIEIGPPNCEAGDFLRLKVENKIIRFHMAHKASERQRENRNVKTW